MGPPALKNPQLEHPPGVLGARKGSDAQLLAGAHATLVLGDGHIGGDGRGSNGSEDGEDD